MRLTWTDLAEKDLDSLEDYIAKESHPRVAIDIVFRVIDAIELILPDHPYAGRPGRVIGTRELVIENTPFIAVYRIFQNSGEIQILRLLHSSQKWPVPDANLEEH